jgi:hypothetical protein
MLFPVCDIYKRYAGKFKNYDYCGMLNGGALFLLESRCSTCILLNLTLRKVIFFENSRNTYNAKEIKDKVKELKT